MIQEKTGTFPASIENVPWSMPKNVSNVDQAFYNFPQNYPISFQIKK